MFFFSTPKKPTNVFNYFFGLVFLKCTCICVFFIHRTVKTMAFALKRKIRNFNIFNNPCHILLLILLIFGSTMCCYSYKKKISNVFLQNFYSLLYKSYIFKYVIFVQNNCHSTRKLHCSPGVVKRIIFIIT